MLTFLEARQLVLEHITPLTPGTVALDQALGLAAAEDLRAAEPVPPFTNSAMDGYALRASDGRDASDTSPVRLRVTGELSAGNIPKEALQPGTALRIMTGAPMPEGADSVVPIEHTLNGSDWVELRKSPKLGANVRRAGEDISLGGLVVGNGTTLRPGEIAVLAATGYAQVPVFPRAKVAILTTGDELVDCGTTPGPGQIRDANIHALAAQIRTFGGIPVLFPRVPDERQRVDTVLEEALASCDLLLTTGGVSVGDYDFVKPALEAAGADLVFWRVAQKPGGPLGFWMLNGTPVFGIPGNPVAAMLMAEEYVRPALRKMMGHRFLHRPTRRATLDQPWSKSGPDGRVHFLRVVARETASGLRAALTGPQGSGILSSMLCANALAVIQETDLALAAGESVLLHLTELAEDH